MKCSIFHDPFDLRLHFLKNLFKICSKSSILPYKKKVIYLKHVVNKSKWHFLPTQSTPQQPPNQVQHTQSALPALPSLVNSLHSQQQQQQQSQAMKMNPLLAQPPQNMVQTQNALNNNDVNQSFPTQTMNANLSLGAMLGIFYTFSWILEFNSKKYASTSKCWLYSLR